MVRQFFMENYANVFTCVLTLILFMIPSFVDRKLNIKLPIALEAVIMFFIFFSRNFRRNSKLLYNNSALGYNPSYHKRIYDGRYRFCYDRYS